MATVQQDSGVESDSSPGHESAADVPPTLAATVNAGSASSLPRPKPGPKSAMMKPRMGPKSVMEKARSTQESTSSSSSATQVFTPSQTSTPRPKIGPKSAMAKAKSQSPSPAVPVAKEKPYPTRVSPKKAPVVESSDEETSDGSSSSDSEQGDPSPTLLSLVDQAKKAQAVLANNGCAKSSITVTINCANFDRCKSNFLKNLDSNTILCKNCRVSAGLS